MVRPCGLVMDPKYPYLGASPNGFVSCGCCGCGLWGTYVPSSFGITCLLLKNHYQIHPIVLKEMQFEKFIFPCHTNITIKFKVKLLCVIPSCVITFAGHHKEDTLIMLAEMTA